MGTLVFLALWTAGYKEGLTDYQLLPQLISMDSIAVGIFLLWRQGTKNPSS